jgi:hypothetical protein
MLGAWHLVRAAWAAAMVGACAGLAAFDAVIGREATSPGAPR